MAEEVRELTVGYSPCPNDTFVFHALIHGRISSPFHFKELLDDVETLNRMAFEERLDITKISFHAFAYVRHLYRLLRSGAALGRGCGPLLVAHRDSVREDLSNGKVAIPGEFTTAYLLLRLFDPSLQNIVVLPFRKIPAAVAHGDAGAGLIIHESRFTYRNYGLGEVVDLGKWWEESTGLPIPLGGIVMKRNLGSNMACAIGEKIRESIEHAYEHPEESSSYIQRHAQEIDEAVVRQHIGLYVNQFSLDIGDEGEKAIRFLFTEAERKKIIPHSHHDIF
jgi:1,4-dihydroxy-6-naphthoate synthase